MQDGRQSNEQELASSSDQSSELPASSSSKGATPTLTQIAQALPPKPVKDKKKHLPKPDMFNKYLILEGWSHWFFRLGFASIFFVNAVYAIFEPQSFANVLKDNVIAGQLGITDILVKVAIFNDLILSVFIVGGWRKQIVYTWAGAWLLLPAGMKLMNLIW